MRGRSEHIDEFLARSGWQGARRAPLAGDASFRRYERVALGGKQAVLMDAPPEKETLAPFIHVASYLNGCGLSAPDIMAQDAENGFLLLEDLGDDLYARVLKASPEKEEELYRAAIDALTHLHCVAADAKHLNIPVYDLPRFLSQVALLPEWFLPIFITSPQRREALSAEYLDLWREVLTQLPALPAVPVLYDFHAENILWLPKRLGAKRAGLLDFQDAVWGSPAYDLVSLLEDARRDVTAETAVKVTEYYLAISGAAREDFLTAYAVLGAQRNCRIVGTFARLALRDGKQHYLSYMPRVWGHLSMDLRHPLLGKFKDWMDRVIPQAWRGVPDIRAINTQATA